MNKLDTYHESLKYDKLDEVIKYLSLDLCLPNVPDLIYKKLQEIGLDKCERKLGAGGYGDVFQFAGTGPLKEKKFALKILNGSFWNFENPKTKITEGGLFGEMPMVFSSIKTKQSIISKKTMSI